MSVEIAAIDERGAALDRARVIARGIAIIDIIGERGGAP